MTRARWKLVWSALRSVSYWRAADYYGKEDIEIAYSCFLAARPHPWDAFPYAPLENRLAAFKTGWRPSYNYGFPKPKLHLP